MSQEITFYTIRISHFRYYLYMCGTPEFRVSFTSWNYLERIDDIAGVKEKLIGHLESILKENEGSTIHLSRAYVLSRPALLRNKDSFDWIIEFSGKKRMAIKVYRVKISPNNITIGNFGKVEINNPNFEGVNFDNFPEVLEIIVESFIARIKSLNNIDEVSTIKAEIGQFPDDKKALLTEALRERLDEIRIEQIENINKDFFNLLSQI